MERGGRGRRHPRGAGARARLRDLGRYHLRHQIRHGPHALANLRPAGKAAGQPDVDVLAFVGVEPAGVLDLALAQHRPCHHRGVNLITRSVQKPGVDEHHAIARRADALSEIDRRATLFIHDAHLEGVAGQAQQILHAREQERGERDFIGSVQFRLDNIDRAAATVAHGAGSAQVVQRDERTDRGVDHGLRDLRTIDAQHVAHHVMPDVAHQHEAPPRQGELATARRRVGAIGLQTTAHQPLALGKLRFERSAHEAQPVAVGRNLVGRVDGRDGVFEVLDCGERRFEQQIADPRRIAAADRVLAIDPQFDVQPVMAQQDRRGCCGRPLVAHECGGLRQALIAARARHDESALLDTIGRGIAMRRGLQRKVLIQKFASIGDDARTASRVVAVPACCALALRHHVGAVQRIVQAAPARVRGVERVARVAYWYDELWTGGGRDLRINMGRFNAEGCSFGHQVADVPEHRLVRRPETPCARPPLVPGIDVLLERSAFFQQRPVHGDELPQECD